jgi:hypothetical protein
MGLLFGISGSVMAANQLLLSSIVPNINKSNCSQIGSLSQQYDKETVMQEGNYLQITMQNKTVLCHNVDFYLLLASDSSYAISTNPDEAIISNYAGTYVTVYDSLGVQAASNPGGGVVLDGSVYDIGFLVQGFEGSQILTVQLARRYLGADDGLYVTDEVVELGATTTPFSIELDTTDVVNDPAYNMIIKLFDEKTNGAGFNHPFYEDGNSASATVDMVYDSIGLSEKGDNALCLDVSGVDEWVEGIYYYPDWKTTDPTYAMNIDGNYLIAHILGENAFIVDFLCDKMDFCNTFPIEMPGLDQYGNPLGSVDEDFDAGVPGGGTYDGLAGWSSDNTCDEDYGVAAVMYDGVNTYLEDDTEWRITLTAYLNGEPASSAIVWFAELLAAASEDDYIALVGANVWEAVNPSDTGWCDGTATKVDATYEGVATGWQLTMDYSAAGNVSTVYMNVDGPPAGASTSELFAGFVLNFPRVYVDLDYLDPGDEIQINVEWGQLPCGGGVDTTFCMATAVESCTTDSPDTTCVELRAQYMLDPNNTEYWSGLGITNYDVANSSDVTIALYDIAGGSGDATVTIDPQGQYVGTLGQIITESTWTDHNVPLDPDQKTFAIIQGNTWIDGICMIGDINVSFIYGYPLRSFATCTTSVGVAVGAVLH